MLRYHDVTKLFLSRTFPIFIARVSISNFSVISVALFKKNGRFSKIYFRTFDQHPLEIKRPLRTVPLLEAALESCHVFRTRKLNDPKKLPNLEKLLSGKSPYVLFPSDDAIPCDELPSNAAIIAIDGTWRQARSILHKVVGLYS